MGNFTRRQAVTTLGVGVASLAVFGMAGCSGSGGSQVSASAAASDGVNTASVKLGLSPYGDELLAAAAIKRGYFSEVGISFSNGDFGVKTDLIKSVTPLLNNQIEIGSGYPPAVASQLDNVSGVVGFAYSDVFYGYRILAPEGKFKTVKKEMAGGASFDDAITTVMAQLKGQDVILRTGVAPTFYNLLCKHSGTSMDDWNITYLSNDDILRQAESGACDFVSPTGAVEISRLQKESWEPLVDLKEAIEYLPKDETTALRATFSGYVTTRDYAEKNWDTILRFTSVMYRIIDDMKEDPSGTAADFVDYVNDYTGSSLTADELADTFDGLYSLQDFDAADAMFNDSSADFNFDAVMNENLNVLNQEGVLKGTYTADDLSIAKKVYNDLKEYKEKAESLLSNASEGDETAEKAQGYYDIYDYLDAYNIAKGME